MTDETASETTDEVKVGDTIRHTSMGDDASYDVKVEEVLATCGSDGWNHPSYKITDPKTGEPNTVCSHDFVKVGPDSVHNGY